MADAYCLTKCQLVDPVFCLAANPLFDRRPGFFTWGGGASGEPRLARDIVMNSWRSRMTAIFQIGFLLAHGLTSLYAYLPLGSAKGRNHF